MDFPVSGPPNRPTTAWSSPRGAPPPTPRVRRHGERMLELLPLAPGFLGMKVVRAADGPGHPCRLLDHRLCDSVAAGAATGPNTGSRQPPGGGRSGTWGLKPGSASVVSMLRHSSIHPKPPEGVTMNAQSVASWSPESRCSTFAGRSRFFDHPVDDERGARTRRLPV